MKFRIQHRHVIDFTFPIAVFFVFAASSLAVLMLAANIYSSQTAEANNNYMARTSLSYVNEKIRQNDLVLENQVAGVSYLTYIYQHEGKLKELFLREGVDARLRDGQEIMEVQKFSVEGIGEGLFRLTSIDLDGNETSLIASERSVS